MSESILIEQRAPVRLKFEADDISGLVERALLAEVRLTPKPGLVDIRNSGAHHDMDRAAFERSTAAIAPWMAKFYTMGRNTAKLEAESVLPMVRPLGMACESDMLQATGGVNTHRGAIFAFGLLSTAIGRSVAVGEMPEQNRLCMQVARLCRNIVARELSSNAQKEPSKSEAHFLRYGFAGARGEAESGFHTVRTQALPVYNRVLQEYGDSNLALLQTLLHLMAWNDDTNLVSRGGLEGLYYVQHQAQKLLWQGGVLKKGGIEALQRLDDDLINRHLSPGGSADLLAVTWFLSHFPAGKHFSE
ncbi:TPA: triphosphoribosyl-dephospho-CoA synthase CitG [Enterobacter cloacae]|uniref:triphosphoribosyl-dephospho-CoA synthase CitG n=1 Tax=Enterobacter cloacae complex TaxID=354276 RepID=UPI00077C0E78|nr:triphosphoribosyl-dephospho-CoA synthase CitG [Enterobacter cloacae]HBM7665128.1 triphosphoribosyl-dephospho-CoA synthase CitG [Enterobacter cloacae subsp. cloacae]MCK6804364.1 triphosphoribosyl-dephospho-CoA synthase CitG [Enterobacter cloacae]MCK6826371.1 triphosphoribosyl-dephospho-CoA synthase CitG [Enterobacter cloacae]MCM7171486.1 triphosphoribosyl-dephospho-CoA synthase CitG [Enterobacter cloacae]MDT0533549.1 triphosphoribosyl-dephospho-CoA synthase CitG [Enterobacter cloacae]